MTDTQDKPNSPDPAHRLDDLFTTIRGALAQDAATDVRSAGAVACRAILGVLDPSSRATTSPPPTSPTSPNSPTSPLTAALGAIGSIPREQIVEFLVGGLRSILTQRGPTYLTRPASPPTTARTTEADQPVTPEQSSSRANSKRSAVR